MKIIFPLIKKKTLNNLTEDFNFICAVVLIIMFILKDIVQAFNLINVAPRSQKYRLLNVAVFWDYFKI
jgi:hypothetical protein